MELQQLGNLIDILADSGEDYKGFLSVRVMDESGVTYDILSLNWDTQNQCFMLCVDGGKE